MALRPSSGSRDDDVQEIKVQDERPRCRDELLVPQVSRY